ncbi:hypothetical protein BKA70DRAFT_1524780 [Coprinopsis sp. MPI-PUGE-AT-0042]|nr:hypothetical protein BKA70DRAFT_1524780 [Coprinopsis sp. MPI-PUGE-AT-0042]
MPHYIHGLVGDQFLPGTDGYTKWQQQYALSSYEDAHNMKPGLIVVAKNMGDIKTTVVEAARYKVAIATRTGGHQYSGASSTGQENILLDLSTTFRNPEDRGPQDGGPKNSIRTSVSYNLGEFNAYLGSLNLFVPHGQCEFVHLGGHVQTGGYGQLGRSFGLLGDHVTSLEIIDHAGKEVKITKAEHPDLFFAWLGGSPGNMGILTHFTIEAYWDVDYPRSQGLRAVHFYKPAKLRELLGYLTKMNDDPDFPRNYDLCISVLSAGAPIFSFMKGLEAELEEMLKTVPPGTEVPSEMDEMDAPLETDPSSKIVILSPVPLIIVYAQWVPFSKGEEPKEGWFDQFTNKHFHVVEKPMSELTADWIFHSKREFKKPYVKRTYVTKSTNLSTNGWVKWVEGRMAEILKPLNGQWLAAQLQCFGGKNSQLTRNAGNGTAYSWRDLSMCMTIDNFHRPHRKAEAEAWQNANDEGAIGPNGIFSKQDMRVLWGSWGSFDLNATWRAYYDQETYERIRKARKLADPDGTFTPNTFAVKPAE